MKRTIYHFNLIILIIIVIIQLSFSKFLKELNATIPINNSNTITTIPIKPKNISTYKT